MTARNNPVEIARSVLNEAETARFLGISTSALRKGRMNGARDNHLRPPPFIKLGRRVVYLIDDLRAYLESHRAPVR
jgi:hypothetical protein